jgi:hypothetical protein
MFQNNNYMSNVTPPLGTPKILFKKMYIELFSQSNNMFN